MLPRILGIVSIIMVVISLFVLIGKLSRVLKMNPYMYGFLFVLMIGSIAFFFYVKLVRKLEGLNAQRASVLIFTFLVIFTSFVMVRNLMMLVKHPFLTLFYVIVMFVVIIAWIITSKSAEKIKDFSEQKKSVVQNFTTFLWEAGEDKKEAE